MGEYRDLAYAAGVMDSDGYFSITRDQPVLSHAYYNIKIGVVQLWPGQALRFLANALGGRLGKPMVKWTKRPVVRWELWAKEAEEATAKLLPYLLVKKTQARLLLEFRKPRWDSQSVLPCDDRYRKERLREQVIQANRGQLDASSASVEVRTAGDPSPYNLGKGSLSHSYLAGVMDSDGYFKIEKRSVKGMINPFYRIKIGAGQVAPSPAIDLLAKTFGGTIRVRGDGRKGHRPIAHWGLFDRSAVPALAALLPNLVIKAPQARLLLQLRERKARGKLGFTEWTHKTRGPRPIKMRKRCYSPEQVREFEQLYQIVKALHADSPPYELPRLEGTGSRS